MYLFRNLRFATTWVIATIGFSTLIIWNSAEYFLSEHTPTFLVEKLPISRNVIWLSSFRMHVVGSCVCLATGFPLFFTSLLKYRRLHQVLGYIYFNAVLWIAAPAGIIMSPFAKGGALSAIGFGITGLTWWWVTWRGYAAIRQRDVQSHIRYVVRSFSIALSAIFFRVIQEMIGWFSVDPGINYVASVWLSFLASVWLAENCIRSNQLNVIPITFISRFDLFHLSRRSR